MKNTLISILFIVCVSFLQAQDLTQFRGNDRNGIFHEENLLEVWPENGPELLWSAINLPNGYGTVSVKDGIVYATGREGKIDYLLAIKPDGTIKYKVPVGKAWNKSFPESRCVPTIHDGKLYTISGLGEIYCLRLVNGEVVWSVNGYEKFEGKTGDWGYSESPLIVDDKLIYSPGGEKTTIVALDKNNGETIWQSESLDDLSGYASPILVEENGKKIIINVMGHHVLGVDASNGEILFKYKYSEVENAAALKVWPDAPIANTNNPIYHNKQLYITSGYNHVGVKFQLSDDFKNIEIAWIDPVLDIHHGGAVLVDGYIYGSNWINNGNGNWCCINWETGEKMWEEKWFNKGSIIANKNMLIVYDEKTGHVGLIKANPEKFELISSFKVPLGKGPHWSHPAISNGVLYIRHMDALMAFDIKKD